MADDKKKIESGWHKFWRLILAPPLPRSKMTPLQRKYDSISTFPMFLVAILWLLSSFFTWAPALRPDYQRFGWLLSVATWMIFALDMLIRFTIDPDKAHFLKRNWPLLVALAFPPLRIILVASAVFRIHRDRNALTKMVGLYAAFSVLFVVVFGSVITLIFEINAPGANITSYGNALWWGFVTVTTVGYGDFTPITVGGRIVAVFIMFTGAAAVGAVTAAVASRFITGGGSSNSSNSSGSADQGDAPAAVDSHPSPAIVTLQQGEQAEEVTLGNLSQQIDALQAQLQQLTRALGDSTPATRAGGGE